MNTNSQAFLDRYSLLGNEFFVNLREVSRSENWEEVMRIISKKRKNIVSLIEEDIGINIAERIDYTGSPFVSNEVLQN